MTSAVSRGRAKRLCAGPCGKERTDAAFASPRSRVCKACQRARTQRNSRATRLRTKYGLSLEDFDALLKAQGGKCAGCGGKRNYHLNVDHDHAVERHLLAQGMEPMLAARWSVRGLLCRRCNKVLRDIRDNVPALRRLANYVLRPPAVKLLKGTPVPAVPPKGSLRDEAA